MVKCNEGASRLHIQVGVSVKNKAPPVNFLSGPLDERSTLESSNVMCTDGYEENMIVWIWFGVPPLVRLRVRAFFTTCGIGVLCFYGGTKNHQSRVNQSGQKWEKVFWQSTCFYTILCLRLGFLTQDVVVLLQRIQRILYLVGPWMLCLR